MAELMKVDSKKLKAKLKEHGFTMASFSVKIGRGDGYICSAMRQRYGLYKDTILLLESLAGIKYEEIKPEETISEKPYFLSDDDRAKGWDEFWNEFWAMVGNSCTGQEEKDKFMRDCYDVIRLFPFPGNEMVRVLRTKLPCYGFPVYARGEDGKVCKKFVDEIDFDKFFKGGKYND